jgi:hypothetical protein
MRSPGRATPRPESRSSVGRWKYLTLFEGPVVRSEFAAEAPSEVRSADHDGDGSHCNTGAVTVLVCRCCQDCSLPTCRGACLAELGIGGQEGLGESREARPGCPGQPKNRPRASPQRGKGKKGFLTSDRAPGSVELFLQLCDCVR